jgi:hypothetical protein
MIAMNALFSGGLEIEPGMRAEHRTELRKIARVSNLLIPLLALTILSVTLMVATVSAMTVTAPTAMGEHFFSSTATMRVTPDQIASGILTLRDKTWMLTALLLIALIVVPALWFAIRLLLCFKRDALFSSESVAYARRIALLYLASVLVSTLANVITSWTPDGFDLSFNPLLFSRDYILLGLIWLFVWVYQIGARLRLDSDMTI